MQRDTTTRIAGPDDAADVARLLHDFNTEFDVDSPGVEFLAARLATLLATDHTVVILADHDTQPLAGIALVTLRTNVWYSGLVALLDELYVVPELRSQGIGAALIARLAEMATERGVELIEINVDEGDVDARRFYERHGYSAAEPDTGERALYYWRET